MTEASGAAGRRDLPRSLYLDTQFLFAYLMSFDSDHEGADALARRLRVLCDSGLALCHASIVVLDELAWAVAGPLWDEMKGAGTWQRSNRQLAFVSVRQAVSAVLDALLAEGWISLAPASADAGEDYLRVLAQYPLAPADCAHLTIALANGIAAIVTNDRHFHELEDCPLEVIGY